MKVYISADHNGFELKNKLKSYLSSIGHEVIDPVDVKFDPTDDFTDYAVATARSMLGESDQSQSRAILLCGSGQGICMAANRFRGIRAALGYDYESVRSSRNDDDSNVLCLPARRIKFEDAKTLVDAFLKTSFAAAPRYKRRIREMDQIN